MGSHTPAEDTRSVRQPSTAARPYRSHKFPVCERCRKRKPRCSVRIAGQPCGPCKGLGAACVRPQKEQIPSSETMRRGYGTWNQNHVNQAAKRHRISYGDDSPRESGNEDWTSPLQPQQCKTSAVHISRNESDETSRSKSATFVSTVMAENVQMIQNYMSLQGRLHGGGSNRVYATVSDNPKDPALCLTVYRRREGLSLNNYNFLHLYRPGNKSLSAAMVCDLLASSLIYCHRSEKLRQYSCSNIQYAWNLAVVALQEEFTAPGSSTVLHTDSRDIAALLDLNGRPTTSITGNTITSSKTISLSHILGLNRDPKTWKISDSERSMRVGCSDP
ncbi:uncharacterized protein LY89DRAFT_767480 [Mollisia scopiformis]|uniref:Zn(2)-C6 fungal-type domain-containing protein n=1 Tax=Mollisia scopiformis TaxID=149040 RepID=A0A132B5X3_MOLSC|nr:uncharacterized protein LY89DRAFT_767480 [Mollisia scopiformis]KUJ07067.1 hypothetical protein LY89DRAFT_767480 [Mollisia scopiformis]